MSAHTPGPWIAVFDMDERGAEVETAPRGFVEGSRGICNCSPEDALLIAAAPDLLAALIALRDAIKDHPDFQTRETLPLGIQVNAAIAKAGL